MRIAIVTSSYPSFPGDPCGHFVETEARRLARDADVVVLTARPGSGSLPTIEDGVTVWRLAGGDAFGWPGLATRVQLRPERVFAAAGWMLAARRLLHGLPHFDRVIAHWAVPCALPVAHGAGPLEVVSHGADVRLLCRLPSPFRRSIVRRIVRDATRWRFVSRALENELAEALPHHERAALARIACVEPAEIEIPDVQRESARLRAQVAPRGPLFVCVGRLVATKRFEHALAHVAAVGGSVVVVGDGPERGPLEAYARKHAIDARFVGKTSRDVALAWIGAADALLHASRTEGLSTVIREAEALGVSVEIV